MSLEYGFTADQIINEERVSRRDIDTIKAWSTCQELPVPALSDEQSVMFLLSCDNDLEATKTTIKAFYNSRKEGFALFSDRDVDRSDLQLQLKTVEFCVFPRRTDEGDAIIFHRLYDTVYSRYCMEPSMKLLFMTLDAAIHNHPPKGLVILFDMKGVGMMHLTRVKLHCIRIFFQYLQEGLPVKLNRVHVLNATMLDKVMIIMKPFIKKEVLELIHFHSSGIKMEDFHEKFIPKKCLPVEFGGDLPSVRELHEENIKFLRNMKSFFEAEEKQRTNIC